MGTEFFIAVDAFPVELFGQDNSSHILDTKMELSI